VVQVSTPRTPCDKVAGKNGEKQLPKWISGSGYTGFYMRVLEEGLVETGDAFERVERHPDGIAIARVNDIIYGRFRDLDLIEYLVGLPEFGNAGPDGVRVVAREVAAGEDRRMVSALGDVAWA
ncbi:MAG TPA: MOSC domain-containing protein, partial [Rubrobacteraceae bacterium]|nr:MOSC domain-containing protein [Rubrobacteraceae bacterium]